MKLIAFSGKATSGKTTAAKHIRSMLGDFGAIRGFAGPLKEIVVKHFGYVVTPDDLIYNKNKIIDISGRKLTVRDLMIEVGQMYRKVDPDYWVRQLVDEIHGLGDGYRACCIDDTRFPNEYDKLKSMGAMMVRIERPGIPIIDDISEWSLDNHAFDIRIHNEGTKEEFEKMVGEELQPYVLSRKPLM